MTKKIKINLDDPETRAVWEAALDAKREVASWPAWKRGEQPTMTCPGCGRDEPDFDGFGMLAHTKPAFPNGCGWCRHAGRSNGVCDYCGDVRKDDER